MKKNGKRTRGQRRAENDRLLAAGIFSSSSMSSGLGKAWRERKSMKGKDKVLTPVTSGGLLSLGKKK
jgi:hypothetical protein